jgi:hypothetical protein
MVLQPQLVEGTFPHHVRLRSPASGQADCSSPSGVGQDRAGSGGQRELFKLGTGETGDDAVTDLYILRLVLFIQ